MTKRGKIALGEYYHVYNRGNDKQKIFKDHRDWIRFLFLIIYFQSDLPFYNISRQVSYFVKHQTFNISEKVLNEILKNRTVELVGFAFMPNHFHLILHETKEGGISKYMQRVQDAYTKYFNVKHKRSGHLLQGVFQRVLVKSDEQLLRLSAYIHRNPRELKLWRNKESQYTWSSYQDYLNKNRWKELLKTDIIIDQFSGPKGYAGFVKTSGTKLKEEKEIFLEELE
jgi:putative transposase